MGKPVTLELTHCMQLRELHMKLEYIKCGIKEKHCMWNVQVSTMVQQINT